MSYEDFVEGIRPVLGEGGGIRYELNKGIFRRICERASADPDLPYALFIDEINRGNISKIFGELITLIEDDKRMTGQDDDLTVTLPYSKEKFGVPNNLYIIGTMNTADRSIAIMDTALRRRFEFEELRPDPMLVPETVGKINFRKVFEAINDLISDQLSPDYVLGHGYFKKERCSDVEGLKRVWNNQILPLLKEYFWDSPEKLRAALGPFCRDDVREIDGDLSLLPRIKFISENEDFEGAMRKLESHLGR